jgi:hypothetical protein
MRVAATAAQIGTNPSPATRAVESIPRPLERPSIAGTARSGGGWRRAPDAGRARTSASRSRGSAATPAAQMWARDPFAACVNRTAASGSESGSSRRTRSGRAARSASERR